MAPEAPGERLADVKKIFAGVNEEKDLRVPKKDLRVFATVLTLTAVGAQLACALLSGTTRSCRSSPECSQLQVMLSPLSSGIPP